MQIIMYLMITRLVSVFMRDLRERTIDSKSKMQSFGELGIQCAGCAANYGKDPRRCDMCEDQDLYQEDSREVQ